MTSIIKREKVTVEGYSDGHTSILIDGFESGHALLTSNSGRVQCNTHMTTAELRAVCEAGIRVADAIDAQVAA